MGDSTHSSTGSLTFVSGVDAFTQGGILIGTGEVRHTDPAPSVHITSGAAAVVETPADVLVAFDISSGATSNASAPAVSEPQLLSASTLLRLQQTDGSLRYSPAEAVALLQYVSLELLEAHALAAGLTPALFFNVAVLIRLEAQLAAIQSDAADMTVVVLSLLRAHVVLTVDAVKIVEIARILNV